MQNLSILIFTSLFVVSANAQNLLDTLESSTQGLLVAIGTSDCESAAGATTELLEGLQESPSFKTQAESGGQVIINKLTDIRLRVRSKAVNLDSSCSKSLKKVLTASRALQDLAGLYFYKDEQRRTEDVKFQEQPIPLINKKAYRSYYGDNEAFRLESGDIMITKGVTAVSSTISSLPSPQSLFSHIVFMSKTGGTVKSIESYLGKGVSEFDLNYALKNENVRILVLRYKDSTVATRADDYIKDLMQQGEIGYDYELDFVDHKKMSCEEIAYVAYRGATGNEVNIPMYPASINRKNEDFIKPVGLRNGDMMVPADMELDNRFDVVYDWTDYRLIRDSWHKDATLSEIFRWVDEYNYFFPYKLTHVPRSGFLGLRNIPIAGFLVNLAWNIPSDVPNDAITAKLNLEAVTPVLLKSLSRADRRYFEATGLWMSQRQLREHLEKFRQEDLLRHQDPQRTSRFHEILAPRD